LHGYTGRGEPLNAGEIEGAISQLADQPYDAVNFAYSFLEAFGSASNKPDLGGVPRDWAIGVFSFVGPFFSLPSGFLARFSLA